MYPNILVSWTSTFWRVLCKFVIYGFSCGVARGGGGLVSIIQEFSASIGKAFILAGRLGAGPIL